MCQRAIEKSSSNNPVKTAGLTNSLQYLNTLSTTLKHSWYQDTEEPVQSKNWLGSFLEYFQAWLHDQKLHSRQAEKRRHLFRSKAICQGISMELQEMSKQLIHLQLFILQQIHCCVSDHTEQSFLKVQCLGHQQIAAIHSMNYSSKDCHYMNTAVNRISLQ